MRATRGPELLRERAIRRAATASVRGIVASLVPLAVLAILALAACGAADSTAGSLHDGSAVSASRASSGPQPLSSGLLIERFFPLVNGYVYSYETMSDSGERGILITRAARSSPTHGELRSGATARGFAYTREGVVSASTGTFVLKLPLAVGTSWRGEHGGVTRISAVDVAAVVPAGRFTGCVQTVEERRGDRPVRYATTFCPDVGVVTLEAEGFAALERAELKSYAPPVDLGPDGVTLTRP